MRRIIIRQKMILSFFFIVLISCKKSPTIFPNNFIPDPIPENVFTPANNTKAYGIVINPVKSTELMFNANDKLIVLAVD